MLSKLFGRKCITLLLLLGASGIVIGIQYLIYAESYPVRPVTCTITGATKNKMLLKCGDKDYWTTDWRLAIDAIRSHGTEVSGMLYRDGGVYEK